MISHKKFSFFVLDVGLIRSFIEEVLTWRYVAESRVRGVQRGRSHDINKPKMSVNKWC